MNNHEEPLAESAANLVGLLAKELDNPAGIIDPNDELDWFSLVIGWAIAKGLKPDEARSFSTYIRYSTDFC